MISVAAHTENLLGEFPIWDTHAQCLWWVDILQSQLFQLVPATGDVRRWGLHAPASVIAPQQNSAKLVLVCKGGLYRFCPETGAQEKICPFEEHLAGNRPNDGKCAPNGQLWVSSMDHAEENASGILYRMEHDHRFTPIMRGLHIPNTLAWSPDRQTFYFADSAQQTIWAFDHDQDTGNIHNQRPFVSLVGTDIYPDGSTIDAEGCLWNAQWNGWRVACYAPCGMIKQIIEMPVACPTSCMFGGESLQTLYVTSARKGQTAAALENQPHAGAVFTLESNSHGLPETRLMYD